MSDLCMQPARALIRLLRLREVSAREVMAAHLDRINRINPAINAIVARLPDDDCLDLADRADARLASGAEVGPLHGLPIAFKDTEPAVGFLCSQGSPIFRDTRPVADSILVERLRGAGAIPIGKTNVPEFAMGSHTYNPVYGTTRNPYDLSKSAGGSTGGGAAAVTAGLLPFADGSDLGGSLRNPASFNNIVGLRPSVGLVPLGPGALPYGFGVKGAVARTVEDVGVVLSVIAGADPRDPAIYPSDPAALAAVSERDFTGVRVAWCPDLGGLPLDPRTRRVIDSTRVHFEQMGCILDDVCPDLTDAEAVFLTIRRWRSWHALGPLLESHGHQIKPEAVEEIEAGARLSGSDVANAMARHVELMSRVSRFQQRYEFLICTVSQLPPFDAEITWPREVDGVRMDSYVSWMKSAYLISATWCPAISMPAGFTSDGLPVGVQIVGRYREDAALLAFARAFERVAPIGRIRPSLADSALP
jgi:amidase